MTDDIKRTIETWKQIAAEGNKGALAALRQAARRSDDAGVRAAASSALSSLGHPAPPTPAPTPAAPKTSRPTPKPTTGDTTMISQNDFARLRQNIAAVELAATHDACSRETHAEAKRVLLEATTSKNPSIAGEASRALERLAARDTIIAHTGGPDRVAVEQRGNKQILNLMTPAQARAELARKGMVAR